MQFTLTDFARMESLTMPNIDANTIPVQSSQDDKTTADADALLLQFLATLPPIYHRPSEWVTDLTCLELEPEPIAIQVLVDHLENVESKLENDPVTVAELIPDLDTQKSFYIGHLHLMPRVYAKSEATRMTWLHFVVASLDLLSIPLNTIQGTNNFTMKEKISDWVYAQQVHATSACEHGTGFRGSSSSGDNTIYNEGNLAATYSALIILRICGDDHSRVDKHGIITTIKKLQSENGCFRASIHNEEQDLRYIYCACAISTLLNDWSGVDCDRAALYISKTQQYDGAFGLTPGNEGHGGATYTAVAALALLNKLDCIPNRLALSHWCIMRQGGQLGFHGRPNKPSDTCYSFWVGAVLTILEIYHLTSPEVNCKHILQCQQQLGGFSKELLTYPDLLHSYMSIGGLFLMATLLRTPEFFNRELKLDVALGLLKTSINQK